MTWLQDVEQIIPFIKPLFDGLRSIRALFAFNTKTVTEPRIEVKVATSQPLLTSSTNSAVTTEAASLINQAEHLRLQDRWSEARATIDDAMRLLALAPDAELNGRAQLTLGKIERVQGNVTLARQHFEHAFLVFPITYSDGRATARLELGKTLLQQDDRPAARRELEAALRDFRKTANRIGQGQAAQEMAELHKLEENYEAALASLNEAQTAFDTVHDKLGLANVERALGVIESIRNRPVLAIPYLSRAREGYRALGSQQGEVEALGDLGQAHLQLAQFDDARIYFHEALQIALSLRYALGIRNQYNALANLEAKRNRPDNAVILFRQALDYFRSVTDVLGEANARLGLASALLDSKDFSGARIELARAQHTALSLRDTTIQSQIVCYQSLIDLTEGDLDRATIGFRRAYDLAIEARDIALQANALQGLGDSLVRSGQAGEADSTLERARLLFSQANMRSEAAIAGLSLASLRLGQGQREGCRLLRDVVTELATTDRLDLRQMANQLFQTHQCDAP